MASLFYIFKNKQNRHMVTQNDKMEFKFVFIFTISMLSLSVLNLNAGR